MKYLLSLLVLGLVISCGNPQAPKPDPKKDFLIESKTIKLAGTLTSYAKLGVEVPLHELGIAVDLLDNK